MTEARGRMDVRLEYLRRRALETERELGATIVPKPMCDPMRLDGVEALEIQQRFNQAVARGVTVDDRQDIGAKRLAKGGICIEYATEHAK
jgi:hypothetical protein